MLTLSAPLPHEERKLTYIFMFKLLGGTSKGFVKALKALIFNLIQLPEMHETGRFNLKVMEGSRNIGVFE